jgi:hypothetical protein
MEKTDSKERFINTHKMNQMRHTVRSPSDWFPCLCLICKEITQKQMGWLLTASTSEAAGEDKQ